MSMKYLAETITIHGGGEDLISPHHEAEIAQSEAFTGKKSVKIWLHTAMVYCHGKKMSKSLGNLVLTGDLQKKFPPKVIRIYLLSHHYRTAWNYEESELKKTPLAFLSLKTPAKSKDSIFSYNQARKALPEFFEVMDDDLNIPQAIKILIRLTKSQNITSSKLIFTISQILGLNF